MRESNTLHRRLHIGLGGQCLLAASVVSAMTMISTRADAETAPVALLANSQTGDDSNRLTAFDQDPVVASADLDNMRGGFSQNGITVNFGFEIQQFVNHALQNDLTVSSIEIKNGVVKNNFTVTQTTPVPQTQMQTQTPQTQTPQTVQTQTTTLTQVPSGGFNASATVNGGLTSLSVSLNNNGVTSLVQNAANNQIVQTVTTVNVSTQGLVPALQGSMAQAQMIQIMHSNLWLQH